MKKLHIDRTFAVFAALLCSGCVGPLVPVISVDAETARAVSKQVRIVSMNELESLPFERIGPVDALSCKNQLTDPAPTREDAVSQMQVRAQNLGANAIAGVTCGTKQGTDLSTNCWSSITCSALAVHVVDKKDQRVAAKQELPAARSGTAFFVTAQGHLLTNAHVVEGCSTVRVLFAGVQSVANVTRRDGATDLALLLGTLSGRRPIPIRTTPQLRAGEAVVVLGFPLPGLLSPDASVATGSVSALTGIGGDSRQIQISAPVQPGSSGGPVLDERANLVGVTVSKLDALSVATITGDIPQNVNFAISTRSVQGFLEASNVQYIDAASGGRKLQAAEVATLAVPSVARVICQPQ